MGRPRGSEPHTLAQFARRAGISEGRARALFTETPTGLPKPDRTDADGRPLWWAGTIDTWCARTGRAVSDKSLWIFRAPAASEPAVELRRGLVDVGGGRHPRRTMYAIVWDTEHGHVIYLQPVGDTGGDHKDWMAVGAADLIEPRWWSTAVVVMPVEENLADTLDFSTPIAYIYRITTEPDSSDPEAESAFDGVRRWFRRPTSSVTSPAEPKAVWESHLDLADIAKVIGRPIPLWLYDTTTVENAKKTLAYNQTFPITDTITEWPATQARLEQAVRMGMAAEFPAGFAALATDAGHGLRTLRAAHEKTPSSGEGWYLVCRPARPAPPMELEALITGVAEVNDLDLVAKDLVALRQTERDLPHTDPRGDVYYETTLLLARQLRAAEKNCTDPRYSAVVNDTLTAFSAPWDGPVVDAWRRNLTATDLPTSMALRRVRRLVENHDADMVREAYRDPEGRYILVIEQTPGLWSLAEWPVSLDVVDTWTDKTVLAADDTDPVVTLLALTPTEDGGLRTDPVPLPPSGHREAFGYGYSGGTPSSTYSALLRCALGDTPTLHVIGRHAIGHNRDGELISQLWKAISTTKGPLRLPWPQLRLWARADAKTAYL